MTEQNRERTINHWAGKPWDTGELSYWAQLPTVQRRLAEKESDQPDKNWIDHTLETYFQERLPLERCLSLGCGQGRVERLWAERQAFESCDAFDISLDSIAEARELAVTSGFNNIHYAVSDINQIELPEQCYDLVWAVASVHHFANLEHVFSQVARALKKDGLFIMHEYVGANHFQFDDRQRQVINACLDLLPEQYRKLPPVSKAVGSLSSTIPNHQGSAWMLRRTFDKIREGTLLSTAGRFWRKRRAARLGQRPVKETTLPTLRSVLSIDPSEAVRSADIIPVLKNQFEIIEYKPLGGTILQFLLAGIAGNFQDKTGEQLLDIIFRLEDTLMECGDLNSDFAFIVARPQIEAL
jgi:ubiquinone/menaquinone biosynthesis C-methylase UbiE